MAGTLNVMAIAGPALGGALAASSGPEQALWLDAGSYLIPAVLLASVTRSFGGRAHGAAATSRRSDLIEGLRFIWTQRALRTLTGLGFINSRAIGAISAVGAALAWLSPLRDPDLVPTPTKREIFGSGG